MRTFTSSPARRNRVPLLVGIVGKPGGGKTFSAQRLARGMVSVVGGHVHGIDTETNRMLHYAHTKKCPKDCRNPGHFEFRHTPFLPPYDAFSYLDAIRHGLAEGATVTIVDSASDMHEGIGGMLDQQATFLEERCGNDFDKRKRMNAQSWNHVKGPLKNAILSMMQLNTLIIFCFRGREKNDWGDKVKALGTMAIADDDIVFSMTAQGVPTWEPPLPGEKVQTKRGPFKDLIRGISGPMNEEMGMIMARWALGDAADESAPVARHTAALPSGATESAESLTALISEIRAAADTGAVAAISTANRARNWTADQRDAIKQAIQARNREIQAAG